MEAVATRASAHEATLPAALARATVQTSLLVAVATGCWLLQHGSTPIAVVAGGVYLATLVAAHWRPAVASAIVLFFAYTSTGLLLLFMPSLAAASLWLAALAGLVAGTCSWTRWSAPPTWQFPLMLWALGIALSWPVVAAREADFALLMPGDGVGLVVVTALGSLSIVLWLDSALAWDLSMFERQIGRPLSLGVLVAAGAVLYQAFVDVTWLSSPMWIQSRRAPGLMGDANPMAVAAALWAPLAPLVWRVSAAPAAAYVLTALLWYAAWLTGARTVLLLIVTGAAGLAGAAIARRTSRGRTALLVAIAACASGLIVLLVARQTATGPLARLVNTLPLDSPVDLAYEVFWRRDGYGLAAVRAIREHPWSGVGHGAFNFLSSYYHRLEGGAAIPLDNAQNFWRHALAERGVLGFAGVIAITIAACRLLLRAGARVEVGHAWTLRAALVGLGLTLLFGLPIQNPAIALTAAFILAWLHAGAARRDGARTMLSLRVVMLVWVLAIAGVAVDAWNARHDLRPPWRAARIGDPYVRGFGELEAGPRGVTGRIVTDYAVVALRPFGPRYDLRLWVRGSDARHVRVWQNRRLVLDELIPAGVIIERALDTPRDRGVMLELDTSEPGIVVTGEFSVESGGPGR